MNNKILLGIAILVMGIVALPQTFALFAGQHDFYDVSQSGNQVPCLKCHADVQSELNQPGNTNAAHSIIGCEGCHVTSASSNDNIHAATTVACTSCHNNEYVFQHSSASTQCIVCHGNSPITMVKMDATNILGTNESHRVLAVGAEQSNLMKGMNEACIGCHTHVVVNATWIKPSTLEFTADSSNGEWNVSDFNARR